MVGFPCRRLEETQTYLPFDLSESAVRLPLKASVGQAGTHSRPHAGRGCTKCAEPCSVRQEQGRKGGTTRHAATLVARPTSRIGTDPIADPPLTDSQSVGPGSHHEQRFRRAAGRGGGWCPEAGWRGRSRRGRPNHPADAGSAGAGSSEGQAGRLAHAGFSGVVQDKTGRERGVQTGTGGVAAATATGPDACVVPGSLHEAIRADRTSSRFSLAFPFSLWL